MSFYKYQSAIGDRKEKGILFFKRKNTCASSFQHYFTILCSCKRGIVYLLLERYPIVERVTVALLFYRTIRTRVYY